MIFLSRSIGPLRFDCRTLLVFVFYRFALSVVKQFCWCSTRVTVFIRFSRLGRGRPKRSDPSQHIPPRRSDHRSRLFAISPTVSDIRYNCPIQAAADNGRIDLSRNIFQRILFLFFNKFHSKYSKGVYLFPGFCLFDKSRVLPSAAVYFLRTPFFIYFFFR